VPHAVGLERPRVDLVGQGVVEDGRQAPLDGGVDHRHDHLDPPVEVPFHHVGRAEPDPQWPAVFPTEPEDPRVFEETPHDGTHPDVLRQARDPGSEAAAAPDHEIDRRPPGGGSVESVDDLGVGQPVGLEHDAPVGTGRPLGVDGGDDLVARADR